MYISNVEISDSMCTKADIVNRFNPGSKKLLVVTASFLFPVFVGPAERTGEPPT